MNEKKVNVLGLVGCIGLLVISIAMAIVNGFPGGVGFLLPIAWSIYLGYKFLMNKI